MGLSPEQLRTLVSTQKALGWPRRRQWRSLAALVRYYDRHAESPEWPSLVAAWQAVANRRLGSRGGGLAAQQQLQQENQGRRGHQGQQRPGLPALDVSALFESIRKLSRKPSALKLAVTSAAGEANLDSSLRFGRDFLLRVVREANNGRGFAVRESLLVRRAHYQLLL